MKKSLIVSIILALGGCEPGWWNERNNMSPAQLAQLTDWDICKTANWLSGYSIPFSPAFLSEYHKRGVICDDSGFTVKVAGYTQQRLDADDDAKCQSYGAKPKTDVYINCRIQLKAQREGTSQTQQGIQAQQDATRATTYQNLTNTGLEIMRQSQPVYPAVQPMQPIIDTKCRRTMAGMDCTSW